MNYKLGERLKKKVIDTKQDIDQKLLNVATESFNNLKNQLQKHNLVKFDNIDSNGQLAIDIALKVLEKAQMVRKNLTTEELVKASKATGQKVLENAKLSLTKKVNKKSARKKVTKKKNKKL